MHCNNKHLYYLCTLPHLIIFIVKYVITSRHTKTKLKVAFVLLSVLLVITCIAVFHLRFGCLA